MAAIGGETELIDLLFDKHDAIIKDNYGRTPYHYAAKKGNTNISFH